MPSGRVLRGNEIYLNGKFYPVVGPVRRFLASEFAEKYVLGDYGPDSSRLVSSITLDDFRSGIGLHTAHLPQDLGRTSYSEADMSQRGHFTLPSLGVQTAAFATSAVGAIGAVELANVVYAATSVTANTVQSYNNGADSWASVVTLGGAPTDIKVGRVGTTGSITIVVPRTTGVDYSTNGSSWSANETDIKFVCFWNDLLWGIDNAGILYFTAALSGAWTEVARFQYPAGTVSKLFVGHAANGDTALYIASKVGLHIYNAEAERIEDTPLILPYHPAGGAGATEWASTGFIYYSAGLAVYEYDAPSGRYRPVGMETFETQESITFDPYSWILSLTGSLTHLIAVLGVRFDGVSHPSVAGTNLGTYIRRWNSLGWDQGVGIYSQEATSNTVRSFTYPLVSNTYSVYRFWVPGILRMHYAVLPASVQAPTATIGATYFATSTSSYTPWYVNNTDQTWTAIEILMDSVHPSASETIALSYAVDFVESYTTVATKAATGLTRYSLPPTGDTVGVAFRAIKFRLVMVRGSTTTSTPDLKKMTLVYHKSPKVLWGFEFQVRGTEPNYNGMSPRALRENIEAAVGTATLVELTFKGESDASENHFVRILKSDGREVTGNTEAGNYLVTAVEVI